MQLTSHRRRGGNRGLGTALSGGHLTVSEVREVVLLRLVLLDRRREVFVRDVAQRHQSLFCNVDKFFVRDVAPSKCIFRQITNQQVIEVSQQTYDIE